MMRGERGIKSTPASAYCKFMSGDHSRSIGPSCSSISSGSSGPGTGLPSATALTISCVVAVIMPICVLYVSMVICLKLSCRL